MNRYVVGIAIFSVLLSACDSTADFTGTTAQTPAAPGPGPGVPDQAVGGIWTGFDDGGNFIIVLSTDTGRFNLLIEDTAEQGVGTATANGDVLTVNYTQVARFGLTLFDGSSSASCSGSGTIQERQTLSVSVDCTTSGGQIFDTSAVLAYDSLGDVDSDLSLIAGVFTDENAVVTSIAGDGGLFAQDAVFGCVENGQIDIIDPAYNLYDVSISYSNCVAPFDAFNGTTLTGFMLFNNTAAPDLLGFALTGRVNGVTITADYTLERL